MRRAIRICWVLSFFIVAGNVDAGLIQYTSRASWEAQVTGKVTHDFNDRPNTYHTALTLGDVTFSSPYGVHNNLLWISDPNSGHANRNYSRFPVW